MKQEIQNLINSAQRAQKAIEDIDIDQPPALAFDADTDSGIYRSSPNTWHLVAGGVTSRAILLHIELTGDDEADSRVVGTLKSMIDFLENLEDEEDEGED